MQEGMELAGFTLLKRIGEGGMGEVWLAEQKSMSRTVALKILDPVLATKENFTARFIKEVKISAKLDHPNIVTAHDAGEKDGLHFLAMSYVEGETLEDILYTEGKLPEKDCLHIAKAIARALDYAWTEFKILHRDIKPSNVIIDKNEVPMLLDMGISKSLTEESSVTVTGFLLGTPSYISPEQAVGDREIDCRADIYSLGVMLYHMLSGEVPFKGEIAMQIAMQHIHDQAPDIQKLNPEISDQCAALVRKMMSKKREFRQKDWKELMNDINLVLQGEFPSDTQVEAAEEETSERSREVRPTKIKPSPELSFDLEDDKIEATLPGKTKPLPSKNLLYARLALGLFLLGIILLMAYMINLLFQKKENSEPEKLNIVKEVSTPENNEKTPLDVNPLEAGTIEKTEGTDPETWLLKKSKAEQEADKAKADAKRDKELDTAEAELDAKMKPDKKTEETPEIPSLDGTKWDDSKP